MPDFVTRETGDGQTGDEIVIEAEWNAMKAGTAVMMVIQRTIVIMLVAVMRMAALAIVLLVGADVVHFLDGEDTGSQSGEDAENEKPCQEETHDGFVDRPKSGKFK